MKEKKKKKKNSSQTQFSSIDYAVKLCNSPLHPEIRKTEIQKNILDTCEFYLVYKQALKHH